MRRAIEKMKTLTSQTKATHVAAFTSLARTTSKAIRAIKKTTLILFSVAVLLAGGAAAVRGQSALDGFDPNANGGISVVVVQPDGKILIGGGFSTLSPNGGAAVTRNRIARLNADGTLDTAFNPNANSDVNAIALQADGKILMGGFFTIVGGQTRNRIARLNPDGTLDTAFDPNANGSVYSIWVQADGKILVGGDFSGANSIGGATRNRIARLDAMSGLADSFNPNADLIVYAIAIQTDGKILAGGEFTNIGGQTRNRIARLDATTGLADSFDPNANDYVDSIAVQADGKVLAGGYFTSIGGQTRSLFARLSNDTAALQNLATTQTTIIWTRSGSGPQFTRVTFEDSTDNVNYSSLGSGTRSGNTWSLTGLSLSALQNIYVRARGYYPSGSYDGSESIRESIRNAYPAKSDQTITVGTHAPASAAYNSQFTVAATADSGLAVAYSSSGVCTRVAVEPYCPRVVPGSIPPTSIWLLTVLTRRCARKEVKNRCFELKS